MTFHFDLTLLVDVTLSRSSDGWPSKEPAEINRRTLTATLRTREVRTKTGVPWYTKRSHDLCEQPGFKNLIVNSVKALS